ncbi:hypothetical protein [Chryseobacterium carnipullorum]|uniref:hypothetical protein n=1 Tax=Chryseobacterium carnipullorum TaxID=1124835 RepID=UPI00093376A9|nr:hypothetical protein [Chryseobacterium carnipullorum]
MKKGKSSQETGFYSFKWRNYMPDVGRFFNLDPLAEIYTHNSPYAFSENRVIDARELEGLEAIDTNVLAPNSTHKSIDNDLSKRLVDIVKNEINERK